MSDRVIKMIAILVSVVASVSIITVIFGFLGNDDDALKATCIAFLCSSLTLDIYPRLTARFSES